MDAKGTSLAVANSDGTVQLWDIASERRTITLTGHTLGAITAAFSPSGSTLVSSGNDTIRLWNLDAGRRRATSATWWGPPSTGTAGAN
ncbi:hypothetical protein AB0H92_02250 [Streptomyces phaeochromogenes]|uniref:WD40 repeat domain-containing protein n=1 Tax=Streptomyces phaeochromogenes TaxID=1923 RepID=UPI00340346A1